MYQERVETQLKRVFLSVFAGNMGVIITSSVQNRDADYLSESRDEYFVLDMSNMAGRGHLLMAASPLLALPPW